MIRDYGRELREDARGERGKEASLVATAVGLLVAKTLWNLIPGLTQQGMDYAKQKAKQKTRPFKPYIIEDDNFDPLSPEIESALEKTLKQLKMDSTKQNVKQNKEEVKQDKEKVKQDKKKDHIKNFKIKNRDTKNVLKQILNSSGEQALQFFISIDDKLQYKGLSNVLNAARSQFEMPIPKEDVVPEDILPEIGEIPEEKAPEVVPEEKAPEAVPEEKVSEVAPEEKAPEKVPETDVAPKVKRKRKPAKPRMKVPEETGPSSDNYFGEFMDRYREKYGFHQ